MSPQLADSDPRRIVLIEDDEADAGLVAWALRRQGEFPYLLQHYESLEEYLGLVPRPEADVILLDLNLPGYGGLGAFQAVADGGADAAIVVLTGLDDNDVAMAAVQAGAQDYLVKQNVNPHDICRAVRYAAERRATQSLMLRLCDDFVAHVSHELRTPLAAASAAVEMVEDSGPLQPDQMRMMAIAVRNLQLLTTMVGDLINSAMLHSGKISVHLRPIRLADVVQASLDALAPLIGEGKLALTIDLDEEIVVSSDPDRLAQVITNLLANSIKFTPEGGAVTVTASVSDAGTVVLTVDDTGVGIPETAMPHLFERLYQVPNVETRTSRGGLGLGLHLCRELLRALQGDIRIESAQGKGTRAIVTLPAAEEPKGGL